MSWLFKAAGTARRSPNEVWQDVEAAGGGLHEQLTTTAHIVR